MCGLVGFWGGGSLEGKNPEKVLSMMSDEIHHRGPDDSGSWIEVDSMFALAHRRLSIIDLSKAGKQPMCSISGKYVIAFNGEIYNHLELRSQLKMHSWRGRSDTETLLTCIEKWGLRETLKKLVGMFAFALWNVESQELVLARDRIGEKPLYFGWQGRSFLFGSELKALARHPDFVGTLSKSALNLYFSQGFIPAPFSIYDGIEKLPAGSFVLLKHGQRKFTIEKYWSAAARATEGLENQFDLGSTELEDKVERVLRDSVKRQMVSDVPLGAFLSGGIDSSLVVSMMQEMSDLPIKTFTVGFHDERYNEAGDARSIADYLGTDHHELYVSEVEVRETIPMLSHLYDEPFSDASQIPTFLVSKLAKQNVAVTLSGDGGDELFAGYTRHQFTEVIWGAMTVLPVGLRRSLSKSIGFLPGNFWRTLEKVNAVSRVFKSLDTKVQKGIQVLGSSGEKELYENMIRSWENTEELIVGGDSKSAFLGDLLQRNEMLDPTSQIMLWDTEVYLPDDVLVKLDRASMACSLESRTPFLDHTLFELAWKIPFHHKYKDKVGKRILRKILYRYLPQELVDRPKAGFTLPLADWLRGPLKEWAETLIAEDRLSQQGILNPKVVWQTWLSHQSGLRDWSAKIWTVLMFQVWMEKENAR
jgi:asparagine synthase (glutamine-hydrolysing)